MQLQLPHLFIHLPTSPSLWLHLSIPIPQFLSLLSSLPRHLSSLSEYNSQVCCVSQSSSLHLWHRQQPQKKGKIKVLPPASSLQQLTHFSPVGTKHRLFLLVQKPQGKLHFVILFSPHVQSTYSQKGQQKQTRQS